MHSSSHRPGAMRGFTLIELVIVLAIVAVLATVAIPAYRGYVLRSHRTKAQADLMEVAQLLERQFTIDRSYLNFALAPPMDQSPRTGDATYQISFAQRSATAYVLQATPVERQREDTCGTLTLAQTGARTPVADCWR
ncbi:type IV pilin protein [Tahibacter amnicola]|uniref:type IV pilin protein n=1 Tax=Tahibacter amnicola TaxID=2976241 RepID=UPI00249E0B20|nr:type IV pilin protein [Tahibacter amnicola]